MVTMQSVQEQYRERLQQQPTEVVYCTRCPASITISATLDENSSPRMPLSSGAEVLWPRTKVSEVANAMIEAKASMGNTLRCLWPRTHRLGSLSTLGRTYHDPARTEQDMLPLAG